METITFPAKSPGCVLALGPESDGNFCVYSKGKIYFSVSFGDLLNEKNWEKYKTALFRFLSGNKIKPDVIITDLHPLYKTTSLGENLSKKYKAKHIQGQHHVAHIFSSVGDKMIGAKSYKLRTTSYGIACDGTGFGSDGKIWGGEVFEVQSLNFKVKSVTRIGHLENQVLIGSDLAVKEPARMLISILSKFSDKERVYLHVKKYYIRNEFEVLYNQWRNNFNCQETSSTGRILDAVSVLLGFSGNVRKLKHGPAILLENNSTKPYPVAPEIIYDKKEKQYILQTIPLFEYLVKNIKRDKKRLAATAQLYIAEGLYKIILKSNEAKNPKAIFFSGGIANNKIISDYLESREVYVNNKIPRGDTGLSFGQIVYYLLADPRN